MLRFIFCFIILIALTIGSGLLQGGITNRWGAPRESKLSADVVEQIPTTIGDWEMTQQSEMEPEVLKILQNESYVRRTYENKLTGQRIEMVVIAGPHGPTSVHVPEICYSSINYKQQSEREAVPFSHELGTDKYWSLEFQETSLHGRPLGVYYGWSDGDRWQASKTPRIEFAGVPILFKIQLSGGLPPDCELGDPKRDPCMLFLDAFSKNAWPPQAE